MSKILEFGKSYNQSQFGGTLSYQAPEILKNVPYDRKVDVYAFGILMFETVNDMFAYPELESGKMSDFVFRNKVVNENYRPKFLYPINEDLKKLIEQCWLDDPTKRPTFEEIFNKLAGLGGENCSKYFLSDVDDYEFKLYVDDITEIIDQTEKLLNDISILKKENQQLKKENQQLKDDNQKLKVLVNQKTDPVKQNDYMLIKIALLSLKNLNAMFTEKYKFL